MGDRSGAHCAKHSAYRCSYCETHYPDEAYHRSWKEEALCLRAKVRELEEENNRMRERFEMLDLDPDA